MPKKLSTPFVEIENEGGRCVVWGKWVSLGIRNQVSDTEFLSHLFRQKFAEEQPCQMRVELGTGTIG